MLIAWLTVFALCVPTYCGATALAPATDDGTPPPCTLLLRAGPYAEAGPSAARTVLVTYKQDQALPKVWIGVRLTPVPAPLAAHVGERGVMIANVVKGSPADQAGLQQYDVVVAYNAQELGGPQDLTAAVAKTAAGQPVNVTILRKAQPQSVSIKPAERPKDAATEWKYEEPDEPAIDAAVKMYGRALERDANGNWIMKDLGPLQGMPDVLKKLEKLDINIPPLPDFGPDMDVRILRDYGDALRDANDDKNVKVEVKIQVDQDGQKTEIQTDADGKINVTHTDANGTATSATYDDAAALEKADPDAFKLYSEHTVRHGPFFMHVQPPADRMRTLRREYQINVEKKVKEALERTKEGLESQKEAMKQLHDKLGRMRVEVRAHRGDEGTADNELLVRVGSDGTIKVVVEKDGQKQTYEFKSKDEFKAAQPELYEQAEDLLE